jgi:hypothetical protein
MQFHFVSGKYKHSVHASVVHQMAAHIILEIEIWVWPGFCLRPSGKLAMNSGGLQAVS